MSLRCDSQEKSPRSLALAGARVTVPYRMLMRGVAYIQFIRWPQARRPGGPHKLAHTGRSICSMKHYLDYTVPPTGYRFLEHLYALFAEAAPPVLAPCDVDRDPI